MIEFLVTCGISKEDIVEIASYNEENLFNLSCNEKNCIKIINYMKEQGITNIVSLLMYKINIFMMTYDKFLEMFNKYNEESFIEEINEDPFAINKIFD